MRIDAKTSICVVGAGPAGLTTAYHLRRRGYLDVTVLEKADRVGGKCMSFEHPHGSGRYFDMGGTEMSGGYTHVMRLAREMGVPTAGNEDVWIYERASRSYVRPFAGSTRYAGYTGAAMLWAAFKFSWLLLTRYRKYNRGTTGLAGAPKDLQKPLVTWARDHGLEALELNFDYTMKVGYGRADMLCAAYFVKFQNTLNWWSNALSVLGMSRAWPRYFPGGFQGLWTSVARTVNVELNARISRIVRRMVGNTVKIEVHQQGVSEPRLFDQLILCCPLDLPTLQFLDVTETEQRLFAQIRAVDYYSTACLVEGLPTGMVVPYPVADVGEFTGYLSTIPNVAVFFTVTAPGETGADVARRIEAAVADMPVWEGRAPAALDILQQQHWQFFPHVGPTEFAAGYFEQLEALQGHRNTLYISSLLSMETVEDTVAYAQQKVEEQFPDLTRREIPYVITNLTLIALVAMLTWLLAG